jgi:cell division inhibitor SepF
MGLFSIGKKKKKEEQVADKKLSKADQIVFDKLDTDDDQYLTSLADQMMLGKPLILNFGQLDIDQANKAIAFFSGVTYALSGEIVIVQEKVFMFATNDCYDDGTMEDFLKEIVQ